MRLLASTFIAVFSVIATAHATDDTGREMYTTYCASCHGATGEGGDAAPVRGTAETMNKADLLDWIKNPPPAMPKLAPLMSDNELNALAAYVLTLK